MLLTILTALSTAPLQAQGSPPPGGSAPLPGRASQGQYEEPQHAYTGSSSASSSSAAAPALSTPPGRGRYRQLPLTAVDAKQKLDELRNLLAASRPQDVQDGVYEMVEWLQDAADAHYRMANAFAKTDSTKREAASERQMTSRFSQLKREALLLKADLLIKQRRAPEALAPLVDIVIADPKGPTGSAAYRRLQELGFSQELPSDVALSQPTASGTAAAKTAAK